MSIFTFPTAAGWRAVPLDVITDRLRGHELYARNLPAADVSADAITRMVAEVLEVPPGAMTSWALMVLAVRLHDFVMECQDLAGGEPAPPPAPPVPEWTDKPSAETHRWGYA
jgi:hypothetical protein